MDSQPPYEPYPSTVTQPPAQPSAQPAFVPPQIYTSADVSTVKKQNQVMEVTALLAVVLLFLSMLIGNAYLTKGLLICFALFAAAYIAIDYTKNRKIAQGVINNQPPAVPVQAYNPTPGQQVVYATPQKPPKTTAQKALKFALITASTLFVVFIVLPIMGIILFIVWISSSGQQSA